MIGQTISHYRITGQLGSGGMGVVYKAEDTNLDRTVALKFLAPHLVESEEHKQRFLREAKAAASLDHPNICTVYEIGETGGQVFIAMGYIDGPEVRAKIRERPLKLDEALDIAIQAAEGLRAAHQKGVVHRDIKSSNLMLTSSGQVKIMDFGLAQLSGASRLTATETILGTPAYMSPEQAQRLSTDERTDIWSLGVVVYEMVTGRLPFPGERGPTVLYSIIHEAHEPITALRAGVPLELDRVVGKALAKKPEDRYQHVDDMLVDLRRALRQHSPVEIPARTPAWRRAMLPAGAAALLASAAGFVYVAVSNRPAPPAALVSINQVTDQPGEEYYPSLAPDGKSVAYQSAAAGHWDIYVQRVGGANATNLTRDSGADNSTPAFSPDGEQIAFASSSKGDTGRKGLFVMGATGESLRRITDLCYHPSWSPDGKEIVCSTGYIDKRPQARQPTSKVWRVDTVTGNKQIISRSDAIQPDWSPHGFRIAYAAALGGQRDIWTMPAEGGEPVAVTLDQQVDWSPRWASDGKHLYFASDRGGSMNLWRIAMDEKSGRVLGAPEPLTTPAPYLEHISLSRDGRRLAYVQQVQGTQIYRAGFDPVAETVNAAATPVTQGTKPHWFPDPSPDGQWLTFCSLEKPEDIFVIGTDGAGLRQLTHDAFVDRFPRWSPDNRRIAFLSDRSGQYEIWLIDSDGGNMRRLTYTTGTQDTVVAGAAWSPDGKRIAYSRAGKDPAIIDVDTAWKDQQPAPIAPYANRPEGLWVRRWSPDGRKLGLLGDNGGTFVYDLAGRTYQQLRATRHDFCWLQDSRRVILGSAGSVELIDTETGRTKQLLSVAPKRLEGRVSLSPDNRTIYFTASTTEADVWLATLK